MDTASWINFAKAETETALTLLHDYTYFHVSLEDEAFVQAANTNIDFWRIHNGAVQRTLILYLGRIADDQPDGKSFSDFSAHCFTNLDEFNRESFLARRPEILKLNPNFLDDMVDINQDELGRLFSLSSKHNGFMRGACKTIRSKVFAHAILTEEHENRELFSQISLEEIETALLAYWSVAEHMWQRYHNAKNFVCKPLKFPDKDKIYSDNRKAVLGAI